MYNSGFDHTLFINIDDQEVDNAELQEMKLKLQSAKEKNDQLEDQLNEKEFNFLHLQEQYTTSEQMNRQLEEKIKIQIYSDENFLGLQRQYTESTETIKDLQKLIQLLKDENTKNSKELELNRIEIESLKKSSSGSYDSSPEIKTLEQKLKNLGDELRKEIAHGTRLSIEKMKLESYIEANKQNVQPTLSERRVLKNVRNNQNNDTVGSIVIENLPENQLVYPLEKLIIELGAKMYLPISFGDIFEVRVLNENICQQRYNTNIALYVKFKENDMKTKFLANKSVLKSYPMTASYNLREYREHNITSLLLYAEEKLKNNGFAEVFCKNNKVFAKRSRNTKALQIFNKRHVDKFVKHETERPPLEDSVNGSTNHKIDENFYQI